MQKKDQLHVMLIGDDIETRILFKNALSKLDKPCSVADYYCLNKAVSDGDTSTKGQPDIIFLDTHSGADACRQEVQKIKDSERFRNSSLVVFDSNSHLRDTSAIFSDGADVFINKPYDFPRLRKVIGNIVNINWDLNGFGVNRTTYFL